VKAVVFGLAPKIILNLPPYWIFPSEKMNAFCSKGFAGCPGKVPLVASGQCKPHRLYACVKAKMETAKNPENIWIEAVHNVRRKKALVELSHNVRNSQCSKDCCRMVWLPSEQVT
jgi:hypothetical protein